MANRRNRASQPLRIAADDDAPRLEVHPRNESGQAAPDRAKGQTPFKMMFLIWGLPLILFIVVAIFKQCGD
jgi:hypothetical protein